MRKPSPLCALRHQFVAFQNQQHAALRVDGLNGQVEDHREEFGQRAVLGQFLARRESAPAWAPEALGPPRSIAMVWLESAPSRLVTTVEVVGELDSPPSNTTTPCAGLCASGE